MEKSRRKRTRGKCKYTLVEAPDGTFYAISLTEPPRQVQNQKDVGTLLKDFEQTLSDIIILKGGHLVAGSGVHISAVDIFPK